MQRIDSEKNPRLKLIRSLLTKKGREQQGMYLVEGLRSLQLAAEHHHEIQQIFVREDMVQGYEETLTNLQSEAMILPSKLFETLSDTVHSQGLIGLCSIPAQSALMPPKEDLILVLDRIQDPGNMGTLIRTADAAGITTICLMPGTVDPYGPKVVRATAGSIFKMNLYPLERLSQLKELGYQLMVTDLSATTYYHQAEIVEKTALILGNEANGVSLETLDQADLKIKIPIYGQAESLNVAAAGAIVMYRLREKLEMNKSLGE